MDTQSILENNKVVLYPLQEQDFDDLYVVAADPKIWEQHPNKDRWKKDRFRTFFEGALQSKGAFKIMDKTSNNIIGSTRFYDYNEPEKSILIGYTFYATKYWGSGINLSVKKIMLDYIFQFVSIVCFHIGAENVRSQKAIIKLGTTKIDEQQVTYYGEQSKLNYVYRLTKEDWLANELVI
ncbi:MAG: GNAT family N-acetyltransferase [Sediminibacterium sp.]|nr:GNAT family N-acetyltransferase [Sediminibacterium sp.]